MSNQKVTKATNDATYAYLLRPDIPRLQSLLRKAKGLNRTMAHYAQECHVSASTLSRVLNGNITAPLSEHLLKELYAHQDSSANITLDDWMLANGMVENNELSRQVHPVQVMFREQENKALLATVRKTVISELVSKGILLREELRTTSASDFKDIMDYLATLPDLTLYLADECQYWDFYIVPDGLPQHDIPQSQALLVQRIFDRLIPAFLRNAWANETAGSRKASVVFLDNAVMALFLNMVKTAPVHGAFTAVLLDQQGEHILEERQFDGTVVSDSRF